MQPIDISFKVESSSPCAFLLELVIDDQVLWQCDGLQSQQCVTVSMADSAEMQPHVLCLRMQGKTPNDTRLDADGHILQDTVIHVRDLTIDGMCVQHLLEARGCYRHDFNGSGDEIQDQFFGVMGCNGTVTLEFSTPIFLWLLENA
jgi:hypothetical protein